MKPTYLRVLGGLLFSMGLAAHAEEIRDYYAEPGLNPFKETVDQSFNESIDPFGGVLQLKYTDLVIPGNGGLDINIIRAYTSLQDSVEPPGTTGVGWTMHFGRIVVPLEQADKICSQYLFSLHTADNPSLEHPDGSRELLVLRQDGSGGLITKSNWKMDCVSGVKVVTAPNGTVYRMDVYDVTDNARYMPSTITDVHGNSLTFTYSTFASGIKALQRIDASDGREVTYEYLNEHVSAIVANGQRIEYHYSPVDGVLGNYQYLTEVVRPDSLSWSYTYNPMFTNGDPGSFSLTGVTYPYGATIAYTYQHVRFQNDIETPASTAIHTKTTGGRVVSPGTWTFTFSPGSYFVSETGQYLDETVIDTPVGREVYRHYGYLYFAGQLNGRWAIGLLREHSVYENEQLLERKTQGWGTRSISDENYWHGRDELDEETWAPLLTQTLIERDGGAISTYYSNHDAYGNPGHIQQTSNVVGYADKITTLTYYNDPSRWIVGLPMDETIEGVGTVDRAYNDLGKLVSEDRYGVAVTYTYTPQGDIATQTDALNRTVIFSDYHRGIPQREEHPENVVIRRVVNDTGTVGSATNGRDFTTHFTYDALNRLQSIAYPRGNAVTVTYSSTGKELRRGNYVEETTLDGFGKTITLDRHDAITLAYVTLTYRYDALNRMVFQSYPNGSEGDAFTYDALGRTKALTHHDGTRTTYNYTGLGRHEVTDENEKVTQYISVMYGAPEGAEVIQILSNASNILTKIQRNLLGQPTNVFQGDFDGSNYWGFNRAYSYDAHYYLATVSGPEIGDTAFGRDLLGNMTSKQVAEESSVGYVYDDLNRLRQVNYPSGTPSVAMSYDANGNVATVSNGVASMSYQYDENDNTTQESVTIGSTLYTIGYTIDGNDFVSTMTYPSGRTLELLPNALGEPTQTAPYVTQVSYHPTGHVQSMTFANGQTTSVTLDARMRINRIRATGVTNGSDLTYQYDNGSNILGIIDAIDASRTRVLGYDGMNRLTTATGVFGSVAFGYDGLGNIRTKTVGGASAQYNYTGLQLASIESQETLRQYAYDAHGNVQSNVVLHPTLFTVLEESTYTYNHAAQLVLAQKAQGGVVTANKTFGYDGNNQRVSAVSGSEETHYVYSRSGMLLGEYSGSLAHGKEHIYVGAQLVATVKENELPVANAGADQVVAAGSTVMLSGTGSLDPDGTLAAYQWTQTAGSPVVLNGADTATPSFTAPGATNETLTFSLTVTDDQGATAADSVNIIINQAPIANAGGDQTVYGLQLVGLNGTGSSDPEGMIVGYNWQQIAGPAVSLSGATTATPSFAAPQVGVDTLLTFSLTVTDSLGLFGTDTVSVTVLAADTDQDGDGLADMWEIQHFGSLSFGAGDDPDGDGLTNLQEFQEGTDPTVPAEAPLAVSDLQAVPGDGQNMIGWSKSLSVLRYDLYWSTTPGAENGTLVSDVTSPYVHGGVSEGTPYYYRVVAANNTGSALSDEVSATPGTRAWSGQRLLYGEAEATSEPEVAMDAIGNGWAVWAAFDGVSTNIWGKRFIAGSGWEAPMLIEQTTQSAEQPRVAVNGRGQAVAIWLQSGNLWASRFDKNSGWSTAQLLESINYYAVTSHKVVMNENGNAVVVWLQN